MNTRSPFRYFKTTPEIIRLAVMMYERFPPYLPTSESGRVSRVSPVQTALRNCTRDEVGPFGFGRQGLIPSYRKLLWSKAMVVSVAEKSGR